MKQKASIAIINSDLDNLKTLSGALGEKYNLSVYGTFAKAKSAMLDRKAPDLILMDVHLKDISVWAACRMLRSPEMKRDNVVPILAVSPILSEEEFSYCFKALSVNGFISLQDEKEQLFEKIEYLLTTYTAPLKPILLAADDNERLGRSIALTMSKYGYNVLQAYNVGSALRMIKNKKPDIILLDHHFEGANGFKLLEAIKEEGVNAIVIVITGDQTSDLASEYSKMGVDSFANKPVETSYLVHLINNACDQRSKSCMEDLLVQKMKEIKKNN